MVPSRGLRESDPRGSPRTSSSLGGPISQHPAGPISPAASTSDRGRHELGSGVKYIAPEIVVWTEAMDVINADSPGSPTPAPELEPEPELQPESEVKSGFELDHVAYVHSCALFEFSIFAPDNYHPHHTDISLPDALAPAN